jgi:DNA-binding transcriptional ArsR family regulator
MIIDLLARHESLAVGVMVAMLELPQPIVSKHLSVLRQVGVVSVSQHGKERHYSLDADKLKPIRDWVISFENLWDRKLDRIKRRAEGRSGKS